MLAVPCFMHQRGMLIEINDFLILKYNLPKCTQLSTDCYFKYRSLHIEKSEEKKSKEIIKSKRIDSDKRQNPNGRSPVQTSF